jgi:hypothetical protein
LEGTGYRFAVEAVIVPEPTEAEREALVAALREPEVSAPPSAWLCAALREGVGADDP